MLGLYEKTRSIIAPFDSQPWLAGSPPAPKLPAEAAANVAFVMEMEEECCVFQRISPGRSVRLDYWRQNAGVSETDPGSSHVCPAEKPEGGGVSHRV